MAVFIRSVGVTANIEATIPEHEPARRLRRGESVPVFGSAKLDFIVSNVRKRTASLPMEPLWRRMDQRRSGKNERKERENAESL